MYSLNKVGEKTYYLDSPTNIGLYKLNDTDVIDLHLYFFVTILYN